MYQYKWHSIWSIKSSSITFIQSNLSISRSTIESSKFFSSIQWIITRSNHRYWFTNHSCCVSRFCSDGSVMFFFLSICSCVISTMCSSQSQYQRMNPTTQVAVYSVCLGICTSIQKIIWNIYQGVNNVSLSMINWTPFNQIQQYDNIWFFGRMLSLIKSSFRKTII